MKNRKLISMAGIVPGKRFRDWVVVMMLLGAKASSPQAFAADHARPDFSWDRVPVSVHVGLGRGLGPEDYAFLAEHYNFITFTGGDFDREYRKDRSVSFEKVVTEASATIKQHNPRAKVLFYWAADCLKPHNKLLRRGLPRDGRINVARNREKTTEIFDTTREDVREWWSGGAANAVHEYGCDGIFVDGATAFRPDGIYGKRLGKERAKSLEEGMFSMLEQAKTKMGKESILLFNPLHAPARGQAEDESLGWRYLPLADGAMVDDFDRDSKRPQSAEYMAGTIAVMRRAASLGKIVVFKAWPGFTWWSNPDLLARPQAEQAAVARENIEFPLACFLVGAESHCYFCYSWGWLPQHGALEWYPEFNKRLGPPRHAARQRGWTFTREFEHAAVFVDVENRVAKITWR